MPLPRALPVWAALALAAGACDAADPVAINAQGPMREAPIEQAVSSEARAFAFPELTGRVVDRADLLDADVENRLTALSAAIERRTTDQLVVVTVPSLEGRSIEDYSRALGNHWGVGRADRQNGVLLVVAPNERRVRIAVARGLEPILTNGRAAHIIDHDLLPAFREGEWEAGVVAGASSIVRTLTERAEQPRRGRP